MTVTTERPETVRLREIRLAREQFEANTTDHVMTVHLDTFDEGTPYRHLRFAAPGTGIWSWNIVTWPGCLAISGDLQAHTFRRLHDMVGFFRGPGPVNASYWAEKLIAEGENTQRGEARFSDERYVEQVQSHIDDVCEDLCTKCTASLRGAVNDELLGADKPQYLDEAHERLSEFRWRPSACLACHEVELYGTWEWNLRGYDHHFLVALHAVQWGVNTYLAAHPGRFIPEGATR